MKPSTRMRARSPKRARQMRAYIPLARLYLTQNPDCQFPGGCPNPSVVVHHKRGRQGLRLLDQRYWAASCHEHNMFAEDHTGESLACGWLLRIESAA